MTGLVRRSRGYAWRRLLIPMAFGLIGVLAVAAGIAATAAQVSAQTTPDPSRWDTGAWPWNTLNVAPSSLLATTTSQSVTITRAGNPIWWTNGQIEACPWTAVQPGTTGATDACVVTTARSGTDPGAQSTSYTGSFTMTSAMINNGGVVIIVRWTSGGSLTSPYYAEWVPVTGSIVVSPTSLTLTEEHASTGSGTYTVRLNPQPSANVTVTVASGDATAVTVAPTSLTYSTTTWNTAQPVTVTAPDDADGANEMVTVTQTAASTDAKYNSQVTARVTVNVQDNDAGLAVSPQAVTVAEGSTTGSAYTVALNSEPSGPVTVTASVAGTPPLVTAVPGVLTYSTANWNTAQAVTVTAASAADDADGINAAVTVTHAVAAGSGNPFTYAARPGENVAVTIDDDETIGLTVAPVTSTTSRLRTSEDLGTATVTVRLAAAPTATVVLDLASSDTTEGTVAPATLTFMAANWNTAQPVTLTGVDDNDSDGNEHYTLTLTANMSSTTDDTYDSVTATVYATNRDNELGLDLGVVTGQATEAGGQAIFPVALLTQPMAAVTVTVTSQDPTEGVAAPGQLVFTPTTWATAQPVTVTGVDDAVDDGDEEWRVELTTASRSGDDYDGLDDQVTGTTTDNDNAPRATLVLTPPAITENGGVSTVTATLAYPSSEATIVTVTTMPVTPAVGGDYTQTGILLTILAAQTTSTGVVTLTAENNAVDEPDKTVRVEGAATNAQATADGMTVAVTRATLTLTDDDERGFRFTPAVLVVAAGGTTTYTVQLTSEPTAGSTVTVTLDPGSGPDPDVTVDPTRLTFTAMSWATAQPVTLTVAADTTARANLVEHRVTGGAYETEPRALAVTRMNVPMIGTTDPIETTGEPGVHLSRRDGELVMVTEEAGVPPGVRFTPAVPLTRPLTVTVRPLGEAEAAAAAGSGVRLGLPGERVALDVAVTPSRPGLLCLPVLDDALRKRAAGRPLFLLHAGERVAGSTEERDAAGRVIRVCARVPEFSPFAVGYDGQELAFSNKQKDLTFYTGRKVNEQLTLVPTGEKPIDLVLTPDPPAGLTYDPPTDGDGHGGTITGTPTDPMTEQQYMLTATDAYGVKKESPAFMIEVKPGIESRDLALVLAGIGRTWASDAVEILGSRAGAPPSRLQINLGGQVLRLTDPAGTAPTAGSPGPPASSPSPLAGAGQGEGANPAATAGPSPWQRVTGVAVGVARALGVTLDTPALAPGSTGAGQGMGSTFQDAQSLLNRSPADPRRTAAAPGRSPLSIRSVSAKDLLARSAFELPLTRTDADGLPTWTLWGRGAASGFSGQPEEGFKMDGTLYSGYLGLDYRQASLLMGLAVAHSTGEVDYERTGGTPTGVDVKLTSILPYAHWQPYAGLGVWGLLGAGWGDMDLKAKDDPRTYTTTLTSWLGAVGGRQALLTWQGIDLAAKTDAFLTTVRSEAKTNLPGARGHAERVRLLVEGQTAVDLSPVSRVQPRLEIGGRWDSGTAEQGLGLELGGGLAYTQTDWGLSVAMQGRYLLVHQDGAFDDWGASVNVRLDPGIGGEGAYLTVAPVWGQAGSGVEQLWGNAAVLPGRGTPARAAGWRPGQVEVDVGYGLALAAGQGRLTPYGGLALGEPGVARYRLGSRWAWSSWLVSLEGELAEQPGQEPSHGVSVRSGWQW